MVEALEKTHRSREGILDYGSMVKGKAPGEEEVKNIEKERTEASTELKKSITEHKHLMHDFRPLLRSLAYVILLFSSLSLLVFEVFAATLSFKFGTCSSCKLFRPMKSFGTIFGPIKTSLSHLYLKDTNFMKIMMRRSLIMLRHCSSPSMISWIGGFFSQ